MRYSAYMKDGTLCFVVDNKTNETIIEDITYAQAVKLCRHLNSK